MPERKAKTYIHTDGVKTPGRALAVVRVADLRPTDHVLDVGCGDGLVALEVAGFVEHLHGLDVRPTRVQRAGERAAERGIRNATFEATTIQNYSFDPRSWDVTLFMRVFGKGTGARAVGEAEFRRLLQATRRQAIVQAGKPRSEQGIRRILEVCSDEGFDAAWFVQLNLIVANRRGAGARIHALPERVLVRTPSGREFVPAATRPDHPMVSSFDPDLRAAG
jgi:SAM-dependent methyltransferase